MHGPPLNLSTYLLVGVSSMRLPSWDSWLLLRVRAMLGSRCSTLREGGGGVQGGFSRCRLFEGGVMGGVEVWPWRRAVRVSDMGNGSIWGLSLWKYDARASGVFAADTEPERGWGKVAHGVDGVDWMVHGRASGEGLWGRSGVPRLVSWSAVRRVPLSLLVGSDSQGPPSSLSSPPEQNTRQIKTLIEDPNWNQCNLFIDKGRAKTHLIQWHSLDRRGQHWVWHILLNWTRVFALYPSPGHLSSAVRHQGTTLLPLPAEEPYTEKPKVGIQLRHIYCQYEVLIHWSWTWNCIADGLMFWCPCSFYNAPNIQAEKHPCNVMLPTLYLNSSVSEKRKMQTEYWEENGGKLSVYAFLSLPFPFISII